jgi:hypothetical protein
MFPPNEKLSRSREAAIGFSDGLNEAVLCTAVSILFFISQEVSPWFGSEPNLKTRKENHHVTLLPTVL